MRPEQLLLPGYHPSGTGRAALIGSPEPIEHLFPAGGPQEERNIIIGRVWLIWPQLPSAGAGILGTTAPGLGQG